MSNQLVTLHSMKPSAGNTPPLTLVPTTCAFEGNGPVGQMHVEFSQHYLIKTLSQPFLNKKQFVTAC